MGYMAVKSFFWGAQFVKLCFISVVTFFFLTQDLNSSTLHHAYRPFTFDLLCSRFYDNVYNSITLIVTFTKMVPPLIGTNFVSCNTGSARSGCQA